jgi:hypothetical protein
MLARVLVFVKRKGNKIQTLLVDEQRTPGHGVTRRTTASNCPQQIDGDHAASTQNGDRAGCMNRFREYGFGRS